MTCLMALTEAVMSLRAVPSISVSSHYAEVSLFGPWAQVNAVTSFVLKSHVLGYSPGDLHLVSHTES